MSQPKPRKKQWKCVYPGCNEPVKTYYNCHSHVWDRHVRFELDPQHPLAQFQYKNIPSDQKEYAKALCKKYLIELNTIKPNAPESIDFSLFGNRSFLQPGTVLQQTPQQIPQEIPQEIPQVMPQQIPQQIPQPIAQQIPRQIIQQMPQEIPPQLYQNNGYDISNDIPFSSSGQQIQYQQQQQQYPSQQTFVQEQSLPPQTTDKELWQMLSDTIGIVFSKSHALI